MAADISSVAEKVSAHEITRRQTLQQDLVKERCSASVLAYFQQRGVLVPAADLDFNKIISALDPLPQLALPFLDFFARFDFSTWTLLELGAGESTVYWPKHFGRVISYEHSKSVRQLLGQVLQQQGLARRVELRTLDASVHAEILHGVQDPSGQDSGATSSLADVVRNADVIIIDSDPGTLQFRMEASMDYP